jgi:hypothetical protein
MIFGGDGVARPVTGPARKWTSQVDVTRSLMMPLLSGHRTMSRGRSDAAMMGVRWRQASSTSTRYINQNTPDTISPPSSQHHFFPSTSYGGQTTTASSTTSSRRLGSSIFEPDPSPASPPHRRQKSSDYLHTVQAIPVPAPRAPRSVMNNSYENLLNTSDIHANSNYLSTAPRYVNDHVENDETRLMNDSITPNTDYLPTS